MILPICIYGHPVLRIPCDNIVKTFSELDELINNMFDTMENSNGIGISAPQIGVSLNIFLINLALLHEEDPSIEPINKAFINPQILNQSGSVKPYNEGCLSIPGIRSDIERKSSIKIKYLDIDFNEHIENIDGVFARVFQHEYDHLKGILFIDHLPPIKKNILNRKLISIQKGKFDISYPTILKK
jgi:peptide deformylase